jgi:putative glycosyltransferase (TIGR04372 family)
MNETYEKNGITNCDYFPPILSRCYTGPIGHYRDIGIHIAAQNLGLLPTGQRYLQVAKKDLNKPFYLSIKDNIKPLSFSYLQGGNEPPGLWHIYERMQLIKTLDGFMDHYELIEKVYIQSAIDFEKPILELDSDYVQKSISELRNYGLNKSDWFVTLHVRETGNHNEHNNQSINTYIKSIEHITNLGGKVIRVGDSSMPGLPHIKGLIDLSQNSSNSSHLHLYALAASKFFIGTQSGPKAVPSLFNVPSLITNTTMLGLETFRCSKKTIYLPKKSFLNGRLLSFSEVINSPVGYGSYREDDLKEQRIFFESNTENQILNGVKEMVGIALSNSHPRDLILDNKIKEVREQVRFATTGLFGNLWLEENQGWFLADI